MHNLTGGFCLHMRACSACELSVGMQSGASGYCFCGSLMSGKLFRVLCTLPHVGAFQLLGLFFQEDPPGSPIPEHHRVG